MMDTNVCILAPSLFVSTYQAANDHLHKQYHLLKYAQRAKIEGGKACHGHSGHANEETIDIGNVIRCRGAVHDG